MQLNAFKLPRLLFAFIIGNILLFTYSCDKDDDNTPDNEQELITTVALSFRTATTLDSVTAKDLDGPGGNAPVVGAIKLKPNTDYALQVYFYDESKTPREDITEEVKEESDAHLICFSTAGVALQTTAEDQDSNKKPLGLTNIVKVGAAGTGTLTIRLKHEPDKNASDPCSTGETDVEQMFNVTVAN